MRIGFIIADDNEFAPVKEFAKQNGGRETERRGKPAVEYTYNGKDIIAVNCGIGKVNAAAATAFVIADDKADAIISFGLSGAVRGLYKNDIVAGESYVECDFDLSAIGYPIGKKPQEKYIYEADEKLMAAAMQIKGIKKAKCGCGDFFLTDKALAKKYIDAFGIKEFDMETGAVASVCNDANVPFIALRQISDNADDCAVESYKETNAKCEATLLQAVTQLLDMV